MRMMEMKQHMSTQQHGSITCMSETKADNIQPCKKSTIPWSQLPEDIWFHIHSLMPMKNSAAAACVSRIFLRSWRHYPSLILTQETLGFKQNTCRKGDIKAFTSKVDQILKKHSGAAIKTLELELFRCRNLDPCLLNNWLRISITQGTEIVMLWLPKKYEKVYSFPCSSLFGGNGSSIRYLHLSNCALRPTDHLGCLRSLTKLCLREVCITGEELECLLSHSLTLTELKLKFCGEIICLKIPCVLERLSCLTVFDCSMLQMIENKAPNLSSINLEGDLVQISLEQSLQVKRLDMNCSTESNFLSYAITKFPYIVPNVETLILSSISEMVNTPMSPATFRHLHYLEIYHDGDLSEGYDYLSLISFFDSSPVLETFILREQQSEINFDSVFRNDTHLRQMPEHKHHSLKNVMIFGFCSAESMVELMCHILENATSLGCITLDVVCDVHDEDDNGRCCVNPASKAGGCWGLSDEMILEAKKGLMAIERYIAGKVPSAVKLEVRGLCSRCHKLSSRRRRQRFHV